MNDPYTSVAEDLDHLRTEWRSDPKPDVIRRGSAILRRLLVEGVIQSAWRHYGFARQPIILAPDLHLMVGRRPQDVEVALAGGATYGGMYTAGLTMMKGPEHAKIPDDIDKSWLNARPWAMSEFMESVSAIVDGSVVKRREVIKYFANVEGGVHLERSSRVRRKEEEQVRRIRALEGRIKVHFADGLYFELLSIGQAVGQAPDLVRLSDHIRSN
jgi:hypothetical protein